MPVVKDDRDWRLVEVNGSECCRQIQVRALGGVRDLMIQGDWAFPIFMKYIPFTVLSLLTLV